MFCSRPKLNRVAQFFRRQQQRKKEGKKNNLGDYSLLLPITNSDLHTNLRESNFMPNIENSGTIGGTGAEGP